MSAQRMYKLVIEDDEGKAVAVPLIRDEITVGRQEGNTIRLTERTVSRKHARLIRREGVYLVEDLTSYTGTRVNGVPIQGTVPLNDGDQIAIGAYKLAIQSENPAAAKTVPGIIAPAVPASTAAPPPAHTETAGPTIPTAQPFPPATFAAAPRPAMMVPPVQVPAPEAPQPLEGAPTMPVRTLPASHPAMALINAAAPLARLIAMTSPLEGHEFLLSAPSQVIGRTPENDIVLEHKSISRHHAKVVREGDRFLVIDLESANGVRVNGTSFERVELQPGDVLELGHVRLRFVLGHDVGDYDPSWDAPAPSKKPLVIGAGLVAVALLGIAVFASSGGTEGTGEDPPAVAAQTSPPAASTPGPESPTVLLAMAKDSLRQEKWDDAIAMVDKAAAQGANPQAEELRKAALAEKESETQFVTAQRAVESGDYTAALAAVEAIPESSVYKSRAQGLQQSARQSLVAARLALAQERRAEGRCDEARSEAEAVLALEPDNKAAREITTRCRSKTARAAREESRPAREEPRAAREPARKEPRAATARPEPSPAPSRPAAAAAARPEPPPAPAGDPDELLSEAQQAWLKSQYAAAIESARRALRLKPGLTRAYLIIAACSCSLREADDARKAAERLDDRNKQLVRQLCQKSGITIE